LGNVGKIEFIMRIPNCKPGLQMVPRVVGRGRPMTLQELAPFRQSGYYVIGFVAEDLCISDAEPLVADIVQGLKIG